MNRYFKPRSELDQKAEIMAENNQAYPYAVQVLLRERASLVVQIGQALGPEDSHQAQVLIGHLVQLDEALKHNGYVVRNLVDAAVSPPGLEAVTGLVAPPSSQIGGPGQSVLAAGSTADRNCVGAQRSQQADLTAGSADTPTANLDQSLIRVARPPSADHHATHLPSNKLSTNLHSLPIDANKQAPSSSPVLKWKYDESMPPGATLTPRYSRHRGTSRIGTLNDITIAFPDSPYTHIINIAGDICELICFLCEATATGSGGYFKGLTGYHCHMTSSRHNLTVSKEQLIRTASDRKCLIRVCVEDLAHLEQGSTPVHIRPMFSGNEEAGTFRGTDRSKTAETRRPSFVPSAQNGGPVTETSKPYPQLAPERYPGIVFFKELKDWYNVSCHQCGASVSHRSDNYGNFWGGIKGLAAHMRSCPEKPDVGHGVFSWDDCARLCNKQLISPGDVARIKAGAEPEEPIVRRTDARTTLAEFEAKAKKSSVLELGTHRAAAEATDDQERRNGPAALASSHGEVTYPRTSARRTNIPESALARQTSPSDRNSPALSIRSKKFESVEPPEGSTRPALNHSALTTPFPPRNPRYEPEISDETRKRALHASDAPYSRLQRPWLRPGNMDADDDDDIPLRKKGRRD